MTGLSIYLAGPITNIDPQESGGWRSALKKKYVGEFAFHDPLDHPFNQLPADAQGRRTGVADQEKRDILSCDATIAYVNRVSMGTAMGVMYSFLSGRTVVIVAPEDAQKALSPMVFSHQHKVCASFDEAIDFIRARHSRSTIRHVRNREWRPVSWDSRRIERAIEAAIAATYYGPNQPAQAPPSASKLANAVVMLLEDDCERGVISREDLDVESIQDRVERVLMDNSYLPEVDQVARAYIAYRRRQKATREGQAWARDLLDYHRDFLHDLKAPAGNIGREVEMVRASLRRGAVDAVDEGLSAIHENKESLLRLIRDFRDSGEKRFRSETVNIRELFDEVAAGYRSPGLRFEVELPEDLTIETRPQMLRTVFTNLLDNSVKHGLPQGEGTIGIRARRDGGKTLLLEYWNDGTPLSIEESRGIFARPGRAADSAKGWQHGLDQVRVYVGQLGGTIECLPVKIESCEKTGNLTFRKVASGSPLFILRFNAVRQAAPVARRILVADDNATDRVMVRRILRSAGLDVIEASSVDEALALATPELTGMVIDVDFHSDRDGLWLARAVRARCPRLPFVMISGKDPSSDPVRDWQRQAREIGALAWLDKERYTHDELLRCFRR